MVVGIDPIILINWKHSVGRVASTSGVSLIKVLYVWKPVYFFTCIAWFIKRYDFSL